MELLDNKLYLDDINYIVESNMQWERVSNSSFLIVGASSMIGRFMVDVLLMKKRQPGFQNMKIFCAGRDANKLRKIFNDNQELEYVEFDVAVKEQVDSAVGNIENIDYVVNLSSPTGSEVIRNEPLSVLECNVFGTLNLLDLCRKFHSKFIFASTLDIYGNNVNGIERVSEEQNGEVDPLNNRACYFESKRLSETLCKCYNAQYGVEFFIFRFPKVFGPTMNEQSKKLIINLLIMDCISGRNPIMKSKGGQKYSFLYVSDLVHGILKVVLDGNPNAAYNVSDEKQDAKIIDIAKYICSVTGRQLIIDDDKEKQKFFEKSLDKVIDSSKLNELGWRSRYSIYEAIDRMIDIVAVDQK